MDATVSDAFIIRGCIRLTGFHSKATLVPIRRALLDQLKRLPSTRGMPASLRALPVFQQIGKLSGLVKVPGLYAALMVPALKQTIVELAGRMPASIQETQLLLSPAAQGAWTLQGLNWHVDVAADDDLPGIQASRHSS